MRDRAASVSRIKPSYSRIRNEIIKVAEGSFTVRIRKTRRQLASLIFISTKRRVSICPCFLVHA